MPAMVDLPLPLAPTRATAAPGSMVNDTWSTAVIVPRPRPRTRNCLVTSSTTSGGTALLVDVAGSDMGSLLAGAGPYVARRGTVAERRQRRIGLAAHVLDVVAARRERAAGQVERQVRRRPADAAELHDLGP